MAGEPQALPGTRVLPPMEAPAGEPRRRNRDAPARPRKRGTASNALGRFATLNAFVDATAATLTRSQVLAWIVLWRDTDARTGLARSAISDIARRSGASPRATGDAIRHLCDEGLIVRVRRGGLNRGPSVYRVRATRPPATRRGDGPRGKPASC